MEKLARNAGCQPASILLGRPSHLAHSLSLTSGPFTAKQPVNTWALIAHSGKWQRRKQRGTVDVYPYTAFSVPDHDVRL